MTTVRTRTRAVEVNNSAPPTLVIEDDLMALWKLKVASDDAANAYGEARNRLAARMEREGRASVTVEGLRDRPTVEARFATRTTGVIDAQKFRKLVTMDQFYQCISVGATLAKKFATETALEAITTKFTSAPFLEVKAKGKKT